MKLGSLFDGSGGFPLAGAIHGITPVWASEIEPYPIKVTKARFPQMKHLGSVLDVNGAEIEPVDIITFGSPCQDLSVAGKQAGLHKGERSNLFFEAIRIIKEMREATDGIYPRIAVWENVPGAYSSNKGEDFRAVLQAFCSIKDEAADVPRPAAGKWNPAGAIVGNGWSVAWRTFDAQYWGVPQRRKRIYLIADFGSERAGEVLFEQEGVRGDSAQGGTARESAAGDAQGRAGGGRECLTPWDVQSKRIYREDSKWPGLCTGKRICDGSVLISAADAERGVGGDCEIVGFQSSQSGFRLCATHATLDANNGSRRQNGVCYPAGDAEGSAGRGVQCLNPSMPQSSRIYSIDGVYPCLSSNESGGLNRQAVCFQQNQRDEVRSLGEQTGALAANSGAHQTNYLCINANEQVEYINGREIKANLSSAWGGGQPMCYAVQACGDRDNPSVSVSDTAYCLPANPMSDRGQSVCYAYDQYNGAISEKQAALGVNCGMSTGRNGVCYAIDHVITTGGNCTAQGPCVYKDLCPTEKAAGVHAVCYPIDLIRESGGAFETYEEDAETAGTLKRCDYKGTQVVAFEPGAIQRNMGNRCWADHCPTLRANAGDNHPAVCYVLQGNGIDRADTAGCNGAGWRENECYTLNTIDRPAVCYSMTCGSFMASEEEKTHTLMARDFKDPQCVAYAREKSSWDGSQVAGTLTRNNAGGNQRMPDKDNFNCVIEPAKPPRKYIIRRLTPLECCRLQGFPDDWCSCLGTDNPTEDEISFWTEVWETHRRVMGKSKTPRSRAQIVKWLQDPYSDAAEYKMWGNGVALPNAEYVIRQSKKLLTSK